MTSIYSASLLALLVTAPVAAQQPSNTGAAQPSGMAWALQLRAEGLARLRAGDYDEAARTFEAALRVVETLPEPKDHTTIGFFPDFLLFLPPLNY